VAPVASPTTAAESTASPDRAARASGAADDARDSQLTSAGFLATKPREAIDGTPFALPDPLPEEARAVVCDVPPPPVSRDHLPILRAIGKAGTAPGQFAYLRAIAAAPDGSAYYVVDKNGRIQKLDAELHVRAAVRTPEIDRGKPTALTVTRSGDLWVSDTHYARVLVYGPDLVLKRAWGVPSTKMGGFLFLRDVQELDADRIITSDYGDDVARLQVFVKEEAVASYGRFGTKPGEFQRPMRVAIDHARGEVWVCDSVNHRLQVLSLDGKALATIGALGDKPGQLKYPYDVSLDPEGRAWVAEFGNHRIQVFDRSGRSLATWGKAGRGEGQVAFPWGLAHTPRGTVLVIDSGNDRIYELDRAAILEGKG
jgi:DNA-binding beta-propeller fold protein YncE